MIRPALTADVERIVEMGVAFIGGTRYGAVLRPDAETLRATAGTFCHGDPDRTILLAEIDGRVVGMLALVAYAEPFSGQRIAGELVWWVDPAHRGVGGRLLIAAERWAIERGASALQMVAPTETVEALYERRGYVPVERHYRLPLGVAA